MNTDNTPKTQERCPECGSALAFKSGKRGPFLACTAIQTATIPKRYTMVMAMW